MLSVCLKCWTMAASMERSADGSLDLAAVKSAYERHGWVALPSLFSAAELAPMIGRLEQKVDAIARDVGAEPAPPGAPFDRYLLDVLGVLDGDEVSIEVIDTLSPTLIRDVSRDEMLFVVMPMRL